MKRGIILLVLVTMIITGSISVGHCEIWYAPTFLSSDKEALEVLQSLRGSFWSWSNYPKQTLDIDRYGVRLFSEYMGTKQVWNTWEMYYMTVPDFKTEKATMTFADIHNLYMDTRVVQKDYTVTSDYILDPTLPHPADKIFVMKDPQTARRFADAVLTIVVAAGNKLYPQGGYGGAVHEDYFRKNVGWKNATGAVIKTVIPGGPYQLAGMIANDIVLTFNGNEVKDGPSLLEYEKQLANASTYEVKVPITFYRAGKTLTQEITYLNFNVKAGQVRKLLGQDQTAAAIPSPTAPAPAVAKPKFGATVRSLTAEDVKTLQLDSAAGVLVLEVQNEGTAQKMKLLVNDIILEVNGVTIKDSSALQDILSSQSINKMKVRRGDTVIELAAVVAL